MTTSTGLAGDGRPSARAERLVRELVGRERIAAMRCELCVSAMAPIAPALCAVLEDAAATHKQHLRWLAASAVEAPRLTWPERLRAHVAVAWQRALLALSDWAALARLRAAEQVLSRRQAHAAARLRGPLCRLLREHLLPEQRRVERSVASLARHGRVASFGRGH